MFQINWKLKAFLYKFLEFFKLRTFVYFLQKHVTKRSQIDITNSKHLWEGHKNTLKKYNCKTLLEIGAGKSLEQNIFFSYFFNNKINQTTIDINKMLDFDLFNKASLQISKYYNFEYKGEVKTINEIFRNYNISYRAPCSIEDIIKDNLKFDITVSTTTLEHFSIRDLRHYLGNLTKILKNDGFFSALIDYTDHYSHTDKNISVLNYLSFNEDKWKKFNNSFLYQNRLRHQDYVRIFYQFNLNIIELKKGKKIKPPVIISQDFDKNNTDTFVSSGYFLGKILS